MVGVIQARLEVEVLIERLGAVVLGVDEQCAGTDSVGGLRCTYQGVFQEGGPARFNIVFALSVRRTSSRSSRRFEELGIIMSSLRFTPLYRPYNVRTNK
jgi:hypothetical protein